MQIMSQQMTAAAQESNYFGIKQNPALQSYRYLQPVHRAIKCVYSQHVPSDPSPHNVREVEGGGIESKSNLHSHTYRGHSQATGHKLHGVPLFFTPPPKRSPSAATELLKEENMSRMFKEEKGEKQIQTDG